MIGSSSKDTSPQPDKDAGDNQNQREKTADILTQEVSGISLDRASGPSSAAGEKRKAEDLHTLDTISVKIADLGNACWVNHHFTNDIQTRQYRSPEVILGSKWGASTDVWSMAAMVMLIRKKKKIFSPRERKKFLLSFLFLTNPCCRAVQCYLGF